MQDISSKDKYTSLLTSKAIESAFILLDRGTSLTNVIKAAFEYCHDLSLHDLKKIAQYSKNLSSNDMLISNHIINNWEFDTGQIVLESYPHDISISVSETCNAACQFCASHQNKCNENAWLDLNSLKKYSTILARALHLGLIGYGEPLMHPNFSKLVECAKQLTSAGCAYYTITNGMLLDRYKDLIIKSGFSSICISLNAAKSSTHNELMGLGNDAFDRIVTSIIDIKNANPSLRIELSFVVVNQNIAEIPAFIELAHEVGAELIHFRTLSKRENISTESKYHLLQPHLNPDYDYFYRSAVEAIGISQIRINANPVLWKLPVIENYTNEVFERLIIKRHSVDILHNELKTKGLRLSNYVPREMTSPNPYNRSFPLRCTYPYSIFNISNLGNLVTPCCYMRDVPGFEDMYFDGSSDFFEIWNSPAYQEMRRRLKSGPLFDECLTCLR